MLIWVVHFEMPPSGAISLHYPVKSWAISLRFAYCSNKGRVPQIQPHLSFMLLSWVETLVQVCRCVSLNPPCNKKKKKGKKKRKKSSLWISLALVIWVTFWATPIIIVVIIIIIIYTKATLREKHHVCTLKVSWHSHHVGVLSGDAFKLPPMI